MPSPNNVPASPLAFLSEAYNTRAPSLFLITGPSGSGKTTWCQTVESLARQQDWTLSGLLSPSIMKGGQKVGIHLLDLRSGERRRLAWRRGTAPEDRDEAVGSHGITTGDWDFDAQVLAWGNRVLSRTTQREFVLIDELGPLEFRQRQGLQAGLKLLDEWRYRLACVTVRPSLVGAARMRWPWSRLVILDEDQHD